MNRQNRLTQLTGMTDVNHVDDVIKHPTPVEVMSHGRMRCIEKTGAQQNHLLFS